MDNHVFGFFGRMDEDLVRGIPDYYWASRARAVFRARGAFEAIELHMCVPSIADKMRIQTVNGELRMLDGVRREYYSLRKECDHADEYVRSYC